MISTQSLKFLPKKNVKQDLLEISFKARNRSEIGETLSHKVMSAGSRNRIPNLSKAAAQASRNSLV